MILTLKPFPLLSHPRCFISFHFSSEVNSYHFSDIHSFSSKSKHCFPLCFGKSNKIWIIFFQKRRCHENSRNDFPIMKNNSKKVSSPETLKTFTSQGWFPFPLIFPYPFFFGLIFLDIFLNSLFSNFFCWC